MVVVKKTNKTSSSTPSKLVTLRFGSMHPMALRTSAYDTTAELSIQYSATVPYCTSNRKNVGRYLLSSRSRYTVGRTCLHLLEPTVKLLPSYTYKKYELRGCIVQLQGGPVRSVPLCTLLLMPKDGNAI